MPDLIYSFPIKAPLPRVFEAICTPEGLNAWWTKRSSGRPVDGTPYELWFGPAYDWRAVVTRVVPPNQFELQMTVADEDWIATRLTFHLEEHRGVTQLSFRHSGWPQANEHYQTSSFCWAMYLRLLKRYVDNGEVVPYEDRLDV